jgi:predicted PurR-regulated permease PerM
MNDQTDYFRKYPLLWYTLLLGFGFLSAGALYYARQLLIPFSLAALLAMLLLPLCQWLERWKVPRGLAIVLCILLIVTVLFGLGLLLTTQVISFARELPSLQGQLNRKLDTVQALVERLTDIPADEQIAYLKRQLNALLASAGRYMTGVLAATTGTLATLGIILIYLFFFLYYRDRFVRFILMITAPERHGRTKQILSEISQLTQHYIAGVLTVVVILAVLNTVGLTIIGIRQAIFFGVLGGLLNIIPYIGTFIGGLLPTLVALLTEDKFGAAVAVAAVFAFNQFLENNFLTPHIVGGRVKVNPLATIITLLIGGSLWGVAGMVMFIPFLGIAKIIFDHVEPLRPYGYLVGEDEDGKDSKDGSILEKVKRRLHGK